MKINLKVEISKNKVWDIGSCVLIALFLYVSGNMFVMQRYAISVILLFLVNFVVFFQFSEKRIKIVSLELFAGMALIMFFSLLTNGFKDISSYLAILLQAMSAILFTTMIDPNCFEKQYVKIISFFAVASLLFLGVGIVYPNVIYLFPMTRSESLNVRYYNAYIYVFWEETGWSSAFLSKRNAGIFWEPGVYQAFLNLGLFYELKNKNRNIWIVVILICTIITTASATGYLVALLIVISHMPKNKKYTWMSAIVIMIGIIAFALRSSDIMFRMNTDYILNRTSLSKMSAVFSKVKTYLFGYTFSGRQQLFSGTIWNSIFDSCLVFGIPFVLLLLFGYYKYCYNICHSTMLFFVLILIFSTESLLWRPLFLCLLFYGVSYGGENTSEKIMEI